MRSVFRSVNKLNPEHLLKVKPGGVLYLCAVDHTQTFEIISPFVKKNEFKMLTGTRNLAVRPRKSWACKLDLCEENKDLIRIARFAFRLLNSRIVEIVCALAPRYVFLLRQNRQVAAVFKRPVELKVWPVNTKCWDDFQCCFKGSLWCCSSGEACFWGRFKRSLNLTSL